MPKFRFEELVKLVRERSPFYRELYKNLPEKISSIAEIPVLNQDAFWQASNLANNQVLTGPMHDGIVFKSGGTTGNPKFSIFSKIEWEEFNQTFGASIKNIQDGDRVANLFYVGQLYGSLLFITKSLEQSPVNVLQLPVGGSTSLEEMAEIVRDFGVTVLAGVPTTIMNLAELLAKKGDKLRLQKILFGGEALYDDQRQRLEQIFPGIEAFSVGYASTDAGLVGQASEDCGPNEHRAFSDDTILEILDDDTHEVIEEKGRDGILVVTNLTRSLMPIIRYPVGDRGKWLEDKNTPNRKFLLLGRSEEAARIGLVKLYAEDVRVVLKNFQQKLAILNFQLVVFHAERKDGLVLRIATGLDPQNLPMHDAAVVAAIHKSRPLYEEFVNDAKIHPIKIEWVKAEQLETNPRTGKMRRVIDRRLK